MIYGQLDVYKIEFGICVSLFIQTNNMYNVHQQSKNISTYLHKVPPVHDGWDDVKIIYLETPRKSMYTTLRQAIMTSNFQYVESPLVISCWSQ